MNQSTAEESSPHKKLCPHCKSEIDADATRCPHCQGKMRVKRPLKFNKKWVIGIGIFVALITIGAVAGGPNQGSPTFVTGSEGYLRNTNGAAGVLVATTRQNQDALTKAIAANDTIGEAQLIDSGAVLNVPSGTPVQVIDMSIFLLKVRILGGSYLGDSGWIPEELISAQ